MDGEVERIADDPCYVGGRGSHGGGEELVLASSFWVIRYRVSLIGVGIEPGSLLGVLRVMADYTA